MLRNVLSTQEMQMVLDSRWRHTTEFLRRFTGYSKNGAIRRSSRRRNLPSTVEVGRRRAARDGGTTINRYSRQYVATERLLGPYSEESPFNPSSLFRAFRLMRNAENRNPTIASYSTLRICPKELLRSGIAVRTLQHRMEHPDVKTAMKYLHPMSAQAAVFGNLPY